MFCSIQVGFCLNPTFKWKIGEFEDLPVDGLDLLSNMRVILFDDMTYF